MIETFEDFCLYVYVIVDDLWRAKWDRWRIQARNAIDG
jgi:hypothetical protein